MNDIPSTFENVFVWPAALQKHLQEPGKSNLFEKQVVNAKEHNMLSIMFAQTRFRGH